MNASGILAERDGNVGWIRINRPERLNAFSGTMRDDLDAALAELERENGVRCVVITGVGRATAALNVPVWLHRAEMPLYDAVVEQGMMFGVPAERQPSLDVVALAGEVERIGEGP